LGRKSNSSLEDASLSFLSAIDPDAGLEGVLFLRKTGAVLASWTREGVRLEVLSVMAATMLASVDTIVETLGGPSSTSTWVVSGDRQFVVTKVGSQAFLFLVAPKSLSQRILGTMNQDLLSALKLALERQPGKTDAEPSEVEARR